MLNDPNIVILYVQSIDHSASFYAKLLQNQPIHSSPTFVMFSLKSGLRLGLWSKNDVQPIPTVEGGGNELAFEVSNDQNIDNLFLSWQKQNIPIIQSPTNMDFGYTFVACDRDGHRLRIFSRKKS